MRNAFSHFPFVLAGFRKPSVGAFVLPSDVGRKMAHLSRLRARGFKSYRYLFRSALVGSFVSTSAAKGLLREFSHSSGFSRDRTESGKGGKISVGHTIFKGKAALSLEPIGPKFGKTDFGVRINKAGRVLLTFWPAIGIRKYDWQKRQMIALSPVEVGALISLGPGETLDFLHDTSKIKSSSSCDILKVNTDNTSNDAMKRLQALPLSGDGHDQGHMFSLSVTNNVLRTSDRFSVPVTKGELTVIRTACSYILPHLMGWDLVAGVEGPALPGYSKSGKYAKSL